MGGEVGFGVGLEGHWPGVLPMLGPRKELRGGERERKGVGGESTEWEVRCGSTWG